MTSGIGNVPAVPHFCDAVSPAIWCATSPWAYAAAHTSSCAPFRVGEILGATDHTRALGTNAARRLHGPSLRDNQLDMMRRAARYSQE